MKPLLVATSNQGKLKEFKDLLSDIFILQALDGSLPPPKEDGKTYFENAEKKARAYFDHYQIPILTDDSGLEVDLLNKRPGVDSAIYGGVNRSWHDRWELLFQDLKSYDPKAWTARFRCVLCFFDGKNLKFFEGTVEGLISQAPKGGKGFGYDPIFYASELQKTFGEATQEEKAKVSHRARATEEFRKWIALQS